MGITGFFKAVQPTVVSLDKFRDQKGAIDASGWRHKGTHVAAGAARECHHAPSDPSQFKFLATVCMLLQCLQKNGITAVFVFDGENPPGKAGTNVARAYKRLEALERAAAAERSGDTASAAKFYSDAVTVSPAMVMAMKQLLDSAGVPHLTAPYEADAQLGYLRQSNQVENFPSLLLFCR